jgi:signal transduction histidine kinase
MELPLLIHGRIFGVLVFVSSHESRTYGPADVALAQAIAERAALAIENGRLYRDALRATQLRDEVMSVVAHDLRNPLASILMQCALAQERGDATSFARIQRAAQRMNRLIQDLLDISTIEAGRLAVDRSRLSAQQLVGQAVEAQQLLAESAALQLRQEVAAELPDIWGDQHRLLQVLENLIGNATKFTPPGGRVTVGAAPREGKVLFWVSDTGPGIPPDALAHVFDRFWQARLGDRKGAGLGLPITRGIVEAHGGGIWVDSSPGRGSTFFFTVPQASRMQTEARLPP